MRDSRFYRYLLADRLQRPCRCCRGERRARCRQSHHRRLAAHYGDELSGRWPVAESCRRHDAAFPEASGPNSTANSNGALNTVWNNSSVDGRSASPRRSCLSWTSTQHRRAPGSRERNHRYREIVSRASARSLSLASACQNGQRIRSRPSWAMRPAARVTRPPPPACSTCRMPTPPPMSTRPMPHDVNSTRDRTTDYAFNRAVVAVSANGSIRSPRRWPMAAITAAPPCWRRTASTIPSEIPTADEERAQLTTTTGLEVVTPGSTPNSTMINPTYQHLSDVPAVRKRTSRQDQQFPRRYRLQWQPLFH